jgi:hypothetical protein
LPFENLESMSLLWVLKLPMGGNSTLAPRSSPPSANSACLRTMSQWPGGIRCERGTCCRMPSMVAVGSTIEGMRSNSPAAARWVSMMSWQPKPTT